jgi:hypothetical protein
MDTSTKAGQAQCIESEGLDAGFSVVFYVAELPNWSSSLEIVALSLDSSPGGL